MIDLYHFLFLFPKMFEREDADFTDDYLTLKDLLFKCQSGFWRKVLEICVLHLTAFIHFQTDNCSFVSMVLINHQTLIYC